MFYVYDDIAAYFLTVLSIWALFKINFVDGWKDGYWVKLKLTNKPFAVFMLPRVKQPRHPYLNLLCIIALVCSPLYVFYMGGIEQLILAAQSLTWLPVFLLLYTIMSFVIVYNDYADELEEENGEGESV